MIYNTNDKNWTEGPSLNFDRVGHACMVDQKTETIHVMGGSNDDVNRLRSTETLKKGSTKWEMGSNLKEQIDTSAAVSSRSAEYVGYLVGGLHNDGYDIDEPAKTWGLRRRDMEWIEMSKQLKMPRSTNSVVNVQLDEIGC